MARPGSTQPTDVELRILDVLWEHGPSTVRQVHNVLAEDRDTGYSTTLKMMQVMLQKGLGCTTSTPRNTCWRGSPWEPAT